MNKFSINFTIISIAIILSPKMHAQISDSLNITLRNIETTLIINSTKLNQMEKLLSRNDSLLTNRRTDIKNLSRQRESSQHDLSTPAFIIAALAVFFAIASSLLVRSFYMGTKKIENEIKVTVVNDIKAIQDEANRMYADVIDVGKKVSKMLSSASSNVELKFEVLEKFLNKHKKDNSKLADQLYQLSSELILKHYELDELESYERSLQNPDNDEKLRAIWALENLGTKRHIKFLQQVIIDSANPPKVLLEAQRAIGEIKSRLRR